MQLARWGNSLAIRIPKKLVEEMELSEGDDISVFRRGQNAIEIEPNVDENRKRAFQRLAKLRIQLPPGYKFDREEIYEERMRELGW